MFFCNMIVKFITKIYEKKLYFQFILTDNKLLFAKIKLKNCYIIKNFINN